MTEAKKPATPATPDATEFVRTIAWGYVLAALVVGVAIGAAVLYVAININIEDATDA